MEPPGPQSPAMEQRASDIDSDNATGGIYHSSTSSLRKHHTKPSRHTHVTDDTCPLTGASHSNLLDFAIRVCPRCNFHIVEKDTEDEVDNETRTDIGTVQFGANVLGSSNSRVDSDMLAQLVSISKGVELFVRKAKQQWSDSEDEESEVSLDERQQPTSSGNLQAKYKDNDSSTVDTIDDKDETAKTKQHHDGEKERPSVIHHKVEFRDSEEYRLHVRPWKGPLDLAELRRGIDVRGKRTIAQVTTYLITDIPGDEERTEKERVSITKKGFLNNPRVDFIAIRQKMTIESKQVIAALRASVKYYPSVSLQAETMEIWSPFCVVAHHMAELEGYKDTLSDKGNLAPAPEGQGELSDIQRKLAINHLGQVLEFMKTNMFSRQLEAEQVRHTQKPPGVHFLDALAVV
ncbi:hypothetical protein PG993_003691 [Apiospora rasikravindrae]|uniref:Uncharacterized protein n=1 Tax=Apiospora rasikravindrae TaxID=990691 RepID=A0ABR1U074_9PEZI